jgi:hypothetical protein
LAGEVGFWEITPVKRRSLKRRVRSATGHAGESDANPKPTPEFRETDAETDDPVNRAWVFSGAGESVAVKERKWRHRGAPPFSPRFGSENEFASKYCAFLGIRRKKGANEPRSLALTNRLYIFVWK